MNSRKDTYHQNLTPAQKPSEFSVFDLAIIRLLLAGMYFMLGAAGVRRDVFRQLALRLRRAESETGRVNRSLERAEHHINTWSGDHGRHWRTRLLAISINPDTPDIKFVSRNIVCRLRNAQARKLRPKHHSHAYLALTGVPDLCRIICPHMGRCHTFLLCSAGYDIGVRAPP